MEAEKWNVEDFNPLSVVKKPGLRKSIEKTSVFVVLLFYCYRTVLQVNLIVFTVYKVV